MLLTKTRASTIIIAETEKNTVAQNICVDFPRSVLYIMNSDNKNEKEIQNETDFFILTDDDGKDYRFEVVGDCEYNGKIYYALINPEECKDGEFEEYVIVRTDILPDGSESFEFIEDDEEFDEVSDIFEDMFMPEINCDPDNN